MIEKQADLWSFNDSFVTDTWHVITTNGCIKKDGSAVMGRGIALEARKKFLGIDRAFGILLKKLGNRVINLGVWGTNGTPAALLYNVVAFPVKNDWKDPADRDLIWKSCLQLGQAWHFHCKKPRIILPRPGCGSGNLSWNAVRPIIESFFPENNVIVVHK